MGRVGIVVEELGQLVVGELCFLQADDVGPALVQPRQQPRQALRDRVDVLGRDAHGVTVPPPVPRAAAVAGGLQPGR